MHATETVVHDSTLDERFTRYYRYREPVEVFRVGKFPRFFVAYDAGLVVELITRSKTEPARSLYIELCERVLARDPSMSSLPLDSPPWAKQHGHWRPLSNELTPAPAPAPAPAPTSATASASARARAERGAYNQMPQVDP